MRKPHTDPILADILEQYILHHGEKTLPVSATLGQPGADRQDLEGMHAGSTAAVRVSMLPIS